MVHDSCGFFSFYLSISMFPVPSVQFFFFLKFATELTIYFSTWFLSGSTYKAQHTQQRTDLQQRESVISLLARGVTACSFSGSVLHLQSLACPSAVFQWVKLTLHFIHSLGTSVPVSPWLQLSSSYQVHFIEKQNQSKAVLNDNLFTSLHHFSHTFTDLLHFKI